MKTSKFTDSQIMSILKQAESGTPVATLCREHGMSNATFYKWRAKYGGMVMCAEKTGGFNLVNYRHSSGVYHEQETEDLHRRI